MPGSFQAVKTNLTNTKKLTTNLWESEHTIKHLTNTWRNIWVGAPPCCPCELAEDWSCFCVELWWDETVQETRTHASHWTYACCWHFGCFFNVHLALNRTFDVLRLRGLQAISYYDSQFPPTWLTAKVFWPAGSWRRMASAAPSSLPQMKNHS